MLFAAAAVSLALVATARAQSSVTINAVTLTQVSLSSYELSRAFELTPCSVRVVPTEFLSLHGPILRRQ